MACQVSVDSLASVANAAPGQGLKKRLKKKSKSKAKRESTKEGDEEKTPKDRKEKKSRSKTTPPGKEIPLKNQKKSPSQITSRNLPPETHSWFRV